MSNSFVDALDQRSSVATAKTSRPSSGVRLDTDGPDVGLARVPVLAVAEAPGVEVGGAGAGAAVADPGGDRVGCAQVAVEVGVDRATSSAAPGSTAPAAPRHRCRRPAGVNVTRPATSWNARGVARRGRRDGERDLDGPSCRAPAPSPSSCLGVAVCGLPAARSVVTVNVTGVSPRFRSSTCFFRVRSPSSSANPKLSVAVPLSPRRRPGS